MAIFTDFDINFTRHPTTNDISSLEDEFAVSGALRNLVYMNTGDKPFHANIASKIKYMMFEPVDQLNAIVLESEIRSIISNYESRVLLHNVGITIDRKNYQYIVEINYSLSNSDEVIDYQFELVALR